MYGSDALAGVVNFKLKREFDGVEIDGTWGQTDRSDGTQYEAGLTAGTNFADGRGSIMGFVGYADRELVTHGDRDFSKYALVYAGGRAADARARRLVSAGRLPFIEEGRVDSSAQRAEPSRRSKTLMASYGYAPGRSGSGSRVPVLSNRSSASTPTARSSRGHDFFCSATQFSAVANFRGERDPVFYNDYLYRYNFAPPNALQLPLERKSAFVRAEFELSDSARVYAQGLYSDYSVTAQLAPTPLFGTCSSRSTIRSSRRISSSCSTRGPTRPRTSSSRSACRRPGPRIAEFDVRRSTR